MRPALDLSSLPRNMLLEQIEGLPENWSKGRGRKSGQMGGLKRGWSDEKDPLYGGADGLRVAASRYRDTSGRSNPEDGHLHADVLSLEETVWADGRGGDPAIAAAGRGEPEAQATGGGSESRQADVAGCAFKKTLRPGRRREWVGDLEGRYGVSERRGCRVLLFFRSSHR